MKAIDIHSSKAWVVTADEKCRICIWDYSSLSILQTINPNHLLSQFHSTKISNPPTITSAPTAMASSHILRSTGSAGTFSNNSAISDTITAGAALLTAVGSSSSNLNSASTKDVRVSEIKSVKWFDDLTLQSMTYMTKCEKSITMLVILTDVNVILYDYVSRRVVGDIRYDAVGSNIKVAFTAIECISENLIALGCSDGVIRLWDISTNHVVRSLVTHTKAITFLQGCHPTSIESTNNKTKRHQHVIDECRLRLVSVDAIGGMVLWDIAYTGNIVDGDQPVCTLENTISNNVIDVSYDATTGIFVVLYDKNPCASVFDIGAILLSSSDANYRNNNIKKADFASPRGKILSGKNLPRNSFVFPGSPPRKPTAAVRVAAGASSKNVVNAAAAASIVPEVAPVYRLYGTPPKEGKAFTQIIPCGHPRLPSLGLLACTKSSFMWVLQWSSSVPATSPHDTSNRDRISSVATALNITSSAAFNPETDRDTTSQQLFDLKGARPKLPSKLKIYSFRKHPQVPSLLFAATNIGIFVLEMDPWRTISCIYRSLWPVPPNVAELVSYVKSIAPGYTDADYIRYLEICNYYPAAVTPTSLKREYHGDFRHIAIVQEGTSLMIKMFKIVSCCGSANDDIVSSMKERNHSVALEVINSMCIFDLSNPPNQQSSNGVIGPPELDISHSGNFILLLWPDLHSYVVLKIVRE